MGRLPNDRGRGLVEWILIVILVIMVIITVYFLLRPALAILWQNALDAIQ